LQGFFKWCSRSTAKR